jgi:hypothetical protein
MKKKTKNRGAKWVWLVGPKKQVQMGFETAMWMDNPSFFLEEEGAEEDGLVGSTSYNACQMGFVCR